MIWLLRHGDAADAHGDQADAERPLTEKGRGQARAAGLALARLGVRLDACLSSPRVRALDTATLACDALGIEVQVVAQLSGGAFDAEELAAPHGRDVLLVGHEPDFSQAVGELTGGLVQMKKGGLAGIEERELRVLLRPAELRAIAG
ncbi:SixA phosphatase family protein [Conexibacter woesei]|uniref:Putative phosphohistidine phosphatase, SixA n=1 Tax=Conexibacter woesei (strain DSM 14684 / CCUG 47730 / CIP 108061 / JCM 11494 / NBRC 100937 / ID131577) TaxID=469383 RepID=D3FC45_CONWI|nr:histidine phosphatase family protein [Conexibacter woesei]ADB53340.1 putative phosphohistidine phosphatase, SixA [Conexibacter woesei DSM 14684]